MEPLENERLESEKLVIGIYQHEWREFDVSVLVECEKTNATKGNFGSVAELLLEERDTVVNEFDSLVVWDVVSAYQ